MPCLILRHLLACNLLFMLFAWVLRALWECDPLPSEPQVNSFVCTCSWQGTTSSVGTISGLCPSLPKNILSFDAGGNIFPLFFVFLTPPLTASFFFLFPILPCLACFPFPSAPLLSPCLPLSFLSVLPSPLLVPFSSFPFHFSPCYSMLIECLLDKYPIVGGVYLSVCLSWPAGEADQEPSSAEMKPHKTHKPRSVLAAYISMCECMCTWIPSSIVCCARSMSYVGTSL